MTRSLPIWSKSLRCALHLGIESSHTATALMFGHSDHQQPILGAIDPNGSKWEQLIEWMVTCEGNWTHQSPLGPSFLHAGGETGKKSAQFSPHCTFLGSKMQMQHSQRPKEMSASQEGNLNSCITIWSAFVKRHHPASVAFIQDQKCCKHELQVEIGHTMPP